MTIRRTQGSETKVLSRQLRGKFSAPGYRPPVLPRIAVEILQLTQAEDFDTQRILELLEQDAVLTGQVLKTASSPLATPAARAEIPSLKMALIRLGITAVRDIVLEAALQTRVFRAKGHVGPMERLSRHSSATAHLCRLICRRASISSEHAFLLGLFHDVGIAGALIVLSEATPSEQFPDLERMWPAIDEVHEELSSTMTQLWKLPPKISTPIRHHHYIVIKGYPDPMAAVVCVAEHLANKLGWGVVPWDESPDGPAAVDTSSQKTLDRAFETLELSPNAQDRLLEDAEYTVHALAAET